MHLPVLLLCLLGASSGAEPLARVDDTAITRADLDERLRQLAAQRRAVPPAQALSDLVDEALLAREARRIGLDRSPAMIDELASERRRLATEGLVADLARGARPPDESLREMYHSTGDAARLTLVKLTTREEAAAALERVENGGDVAAEARRSADPKLAARGGDTGLVARVSLPPALAAEVFRAGAGALVGPVQLPLGWAIARVVEVKIADEAGFAARRESLASFAREQAAGQAKQHLLGQLRSRAQVELDEPFLASLKGRTELSPAELEHVIATVNGRPLRYGAIHPTVVRLFGAVRGHGAGAAVIGLARGEIDARLLGDEAVAKGFDRSPAVLAVLPGVERNLLAGALAAQLSRNPDLRDPAVEARVEALRAKASIRVDRDKVAALEGSR